MTKKKNDAAHVLNYNKTDIVNLWLDKYEEIFSDFDPAPFSHRTISDDFIAEAKKVSQEKGKQLKEFNIYIPKDLRDISQEKIITFRLHSFFKLKYNKYKKDFRQKIRNGIICFLSGIIILLVIANSLKLNSSTAQVIFTISEPAGWFLIWMGLDYFFITSRAVRNDNKFYQKICKAKISFHTIPVQLSGDV